MLISLLLYVSNPLLNIHFSLCFLHVFLTDLQQFHSGLEGFDSLSPAALCETPPEQAAAAPRTDWSPVTPAPT